MSLSSAADGTRGTQRAGVNWWRVLAWALRFSALQAVLAWPVWSVWHVYTSDMHRPSFVNVAALAGCGVAAVAVVFVVNWFGCEAWPYIKKKAGEE